MKGYTNFMRAAGISLTWAVVFLLSAWLFYFGMSDWMSRDLMPEYADRNPLRPFFRLIFAILMIFILNGTAALVTGFLRAREG